MRLPVPALLKMSFAVCLAVSCVDPNDYLIDDAGFPVAPDATTAQKDAAPAGVDAGPPLPSPDGAVPDTAPTPDKPPPDTAPPTPDAPPPPDTAPPKPDAPLPPDAPPSPCPGGPPPPDYDLRCGCASAGKVQCSGACSVDDKACVPTGEFYGFSNEFLGDGKLLDTYGGDPPNYAFMNMPGFSGSNWKITSTGDGYYRLTNMFLGDGRALEAPVDGTKLFMGNTSTSATQAWKITGAGNGYLRIRNKSAGDGRSLDTRNDATNDPFMGPTGDFSGQHWKITKR